LNQNQVFLPITLGAILGFAFIFEVDYTFGFWADENEKIPHPECIQPTKIVNNTIIDTVNRQCREVSKG
jgi:hypothetical protein